MLSLSVLVHNPSIPLESLRLAAEPEHLQSKFFWRLEINRGA